MKKKNINICLISCSLLLESLSRDPPQSQQVLEETVFTSKGFYFVGVELLEAFCRVSCDGTAETVC